MYDLIIIGGGPSGITAAVYAARKKMNFMLITKDIGGQAAWSSDIENYTGYQFVTGIELVSKFEEHLKHYGINLKENEDVLEVNKNAGTIIVKTNKSQYKTKSVIIASGKRSRELGVEKEEEFKNRGITYCATCDGPLFSGKDVAIIGGGNSALDAALQLVNIAKSVYIINITSNLTGDAIMQEKLKNNNKVTILNSTSLIALYGDKMLSGIKVKEGDNEKDINLSGIFVEIGLIPNSGFISIVDKNEIGEIKVDKYNNTSVKGIFAAGDVTDVPEKQIIIAAGEGAKAALSAFRYLAQTA